jgi:hypothetical protein
MTQVREERMGGHFIKYHLDGLPPYAVLHKFTAPDLGDPHDHPFSADSLIVSGGYVEEVYQIDGSKTVHHRAPGETVRIEASKIHRIIELPEGECLTLFVPGPHQRKSGFYQFREDGTYHRYWDGKFQRLYVEDVK